MIISHNIDQARVYLSKFCLIIPPILCRDIYLPLLCTDTDIMSDTEGFVISPDKLMDILHRLLGNFEVSMGVSEGKVDFTSSSYLCSRLKLFLHFGMSLIRM